MKWLTNTFSYWTELISEIRIWWIFRSTAREEANLKKILDNELRVDWLGRIYGVINMPEEVVGAAEEVQQAYVLQQISKFGPLTNELGISDIIFPEISRIPGTPAYLVVMWPQYDALGIWYILGALIRTSFVCSILFLLGRVIWVNFHHVVEIFQKLLGLAGM
jgi:hypothetical protein|tara:strand:- start:120 stop:608 length:489 start_codon:yes stop_codon:yes gene_type:complete